MLPALLNISGGMKVFGSKRVRRTSGQASSPEPSTTVAAARASGA